jgi:hypothetical protein
MAEKPKGNVTQRSWSNYEGPKPYQDKVGTDFYYASRQYSPQASPGENTTQRSWNNYQSPGAAAMGDSQPSAVGTAASKFQQLQDEAKARKDAELSEESDFDRLQRESALKRGMRSLKNTTPSAVDGGSMLS